MQTTFCLRQIPIHSYFILYLYFQHKTLIIHTGTMEKLHWDTKFVLKACHSEILWGLWTGFFIFYRSNFSPTISLYSVPCDLFFPSQYRGKNTVLPIWI